MTIQKLGFRPQGYKKHT